MSKDRINRIASRSVPYDTVTPRKALKDVGKTQDGRVVRQAIVACCINRRIGDTFFTAGKTCSSIASEDANPDIVDYPWQKIEHSEYVNGSRIHDTYTICLPESKALLMNQTIIECKRGISDYGYGVYWGNYCDGKSRIIRGFPGYLLPGIGGACPGNGTDMSFDNSNPTPGYQGCNQNSSTTPSTSSQTTTEAPTIQNDYPGSLNDYVIDTAQPLQGTQYTRLQSVSNPQNYTIVTATQSVTSVNPVSQCTHTCKNGEVSQGLVRRWTNDPNWKTLNWAPTRTADYYAGLPRPVYVATNDCASTPDVRYKQEMSLTGFKQLCKDVNVLWNSSPSSSLTPASSSAPVATATSAGLLTAIAATLLPTPTATIAGAASNATVTGLAAGLGVLGGVVALGGVAYGGYKFGQYLAKHPFQNSGHSLENAVQHVKEIEMEEILADSPPPYEA